MSKWETKKLGAVINLKRGYDLPIQDRVDGEIPVISSSGITGYHDTAKVKGPGVVTGRVGTLGDVYYTYKDYWPHNNTLYVEDFKGNHPQYIAYLLKDIALAIQSSSAAVPALNRNHLHLMDVSIPVNIEIQRKIASVLSAYDDLIEVNNHRIKALEEAAQTLYREWFVEFRFPRYGDVPLEGGIPQGWEVVDLQSLYETSSGGTPSRNTPEYYIDGTISWLKTKELVDDVFVLETEESITELALNKSSAKIFPAYTTIVAMYGATIGQTAILGIESSTNQACCALIPKTQEFGYAFAYLYFVANYQNIIGLGMGAAQQNISQKVIKQFKMLRCEVDIIEQFNAIANEILEQIRVLQTQNNVLRKARDGLLPRLVSGEINVSDIEIDDKGDVYG